jgi:hypothetical protein
VTRALITLTSDTDRAKATSWVCKAPPGTRVEFKRPRRTLPQNDKLWATLTEIAQQKPGGRVYSPDIWKCLFMAEWRKDVGIYPSLDGDGVVPIYHSSDLGRGECADLIEFIHAWCAQNGIELTVQ